MSAEIKTYQTPSRRIIRIMEYMVEDGPSTGGLNRTVMERTVHVFKLLIPPQVPLSIEGPGVIKRAQLMGEILNINVRVTGMDIGRGEIWGILTDRTPELLKKCKYVFMPFGARPVFIKDYDPRRRKGQLLIFI